jgi:hypothetical protein
MGPWVQSAQVGIVGVVGWCGLLAETVVGLDGARSQCRIAASPSRSWSTRSRYFSTVGNTTQCTRSSRVTFSAACWNTAFCASNATAAALEGGHAGSPSLVGRTWIRSYARSLHERTRRGTYHVGAELYRQAARSSSRPPVPESVEEGHFCACPSTHLCDDQSASDARHSNSGCVAMSL